LLQISDMAGVQEVEDAVGEDDRFPLSTTPSGDRRGREKGDGSHFLDRSSGGLLTARSFITKDKVNIEMGTGLASLRLAKGGVKRLPSLYLNRTPGENAHVCCGRYTPTSCVRDFTRKVYSSR
jgi:hypothetical protein